MNANCLSSLQQNTRNVLDKREAERKRLIASYELCALACYKNELVNTRKTGNH